MDVLTDGNRAAAGDGSCEGAWCVRGVEKVGEPGGAYSGGVVLSQAYRLRGGRDV
jgi:hypothetical protein